MGWKLKSSWQKGASLGLNIGNLLGSGFLSLLEAFGVAGMHILFMNQKKESPHKGSMIMCIHFNLYIYA